MNDTKFELSLEIDDSLSHLSDETRKKICMEIIQGLNKILEILGIPGTSKVFITKLEKDKVLAYRFMRITSNEVQCRYPDHLLLKIQNYINKCYNNDGSYELGFNLNDTLMWLKNLLDDQDRKKESKIKSLIEFFSISCLEIVKLQPEILLGPSQIDEYLSLIQISSEYRDRIHKILSKVLNHRISISDKKNVKKIIEKGFSKGKSNETLVEKLIIALCPNTIQIQLPMGYLKLITNGEQYDEDHRDMFKMARDGLFYELGVQYPDFQFVVNEDLKPNCFTFRINHLTTSPQNGLKPEELLVNDTFERLNLLKIDGLPIVNSANLSECSIIQTDYKKLVEEAGLTTWDHMGYLILCFSSVLRKYSSLFTQFDHSNNNLDILSSFDFYYPQLVDALKDVISVESVTRLLRSLVSEEISIRDMRGIFEAILDFFLNMNLNKSNNLWENNNENLTDFVRSSLNRYISHKYTRGGNTLVVYLVSPEIETELLHYKSLELKSPLEHPTYRNIVSVIRDELGLYVGSQIPVILTKVKLRSILREIIAPECPRVAILAYSEISADMNIQPIDRFNL